MIQISNEELTKVTQFVASCNDMINGKFILADIKIAKILNMIAESEELYNYIKDCLIDFDFGKELRRAEAKNRLNNGSFSVPHSASALVSLVFCLLVECDAKRIDFYSFINENFATINRTEAYKNFAEQLLVPFRDIISSYFGIGVSQQNLDSMTNSYRNDLKTEPIFESESSYEQNYQEIYHDYQKAKQETTIINDDEDDDNEKTWRQIADICENIENAVYTDRKLKQYLREELIYIIKTIKYSTKYKDIRIVSALVTAFDEMSKKCKNVQFVFGELKNLILNLY